MTLPSRSTATPQGPPRVTWSHERRVMSPQLLAPCAVGVRTEVHACGLGEQRGCLGRTALDAPFGTSCTSREPIWPTVSCGRQPASANFSVDDADEGAVWGGDKQVSDVALVHPLAGGVGVLVGSHGGWAGLHHLGGRGLLGG